VLVIVALQDVTDDWMGCQGEDSPRQDGRSYGDDPMETSGTHRKNIVVLMGGTVLAGM